jgi:arylsulfatase
MTWQSKNKKSLSAMPRAGRTSSSSGGDDIGISNLSCYSHGVMGYQTPNIDRLAKEGMMFTDSYGEQSCTAGRSSFITGQSVYRTGLSKVGFPGAPIGMSEKLVTIAALLKNQGYATGQFGKNHLGDLNHMLPTNHGFDEFFGNLYHLNAEEEPEMDDYFPEKDFPNLRNNIGPRGVIHSWATDQEDPTDMPRWGKVGKQKIEDTGPLNRKRMETCDDEFATAAKDFIGRHHKDAKPFFVSASAGPNASMRPSVLSTPKDYLTLLVQDIGRRPDYVEQ